MRRVDIDSRFKLDGKTWRRLACGHTQREPPGRVSATAGQCQECPMPKQRHGAVKALTERVRR